jgi:hypothetical protein
MFKLAALSTLTTVSAVPATIDALCTILLDPNTCNDAAGVYSHWPAPTTIANPTQTQCVNLFTAANFNLGDDTDPDGTMSIGCRLKYAQRAVNASTLFNCKFAGFTGGGACGDPVTGACMGIGASCAGVTGATYSGSGSLSACVSGLAPVAALWGSKQGGSASSENSTECRLYHATVGYANGSPTPATDVHCTHQGFGAGQPCSGAIASNTNHYCAAIASICTGGNKQYNDMAQCVGSFNTFPDAAVAATFNNDKGSRQYHMNAALVLSASTHCPHAGPSGGGACGTPWQAWQSLASQSTCNSMSFVSTGVVAAVTTWNATDLTAAIPTGAAASYSTGEVGNTVICRVYHLTVATEDNTHCTHGDITGAGQCGALSANVCLLISTACGSNAMGSVASASCVATIDGLVTGNKSHYGTVSTGADVGCYVFNANAAMVAKASSSTMSGVANICKFATCGGMAAPTSAAYALTASGVLALLPLLF